MGKRSFADNCPGYTTLVLRTTLSRRLFTQPDPLCVGEWLGPAVPLLWKARYCRGALNIASAVLYRTPRPTSLLSWFKHLSEYHVHGQRVLSFR